MFLTLLQINAAWSAANPQQVKIQVVHLFALQNLDSPLLNFLTDNLELPSGALGNTT